MSRLALGEYGELLAAQYLEALGWTILNRRFRADRKEIDLVAERDEVVAFVEVKTRSSPRFGHPLEAIDTRKRAEIQYAAEAWVRQFGEAGYTYRFDAVAVLPGSRGLPRIEHLEDAWGV